MARAAPVYSVPLAAGLDEFSEFSVSRRRSVQTSFCVDASSQCRSARGRIHLDSTLELGRFRASVGGGVFGSEWSLPQTYPTPHLCISRLALWLEFVACRGTYFAVHTDRYDQLDHGSTSDCAFPGGGRGGLLRRRSLCGEIAQLCP